MGLSETIDKFYALRGFLSLVKDPNDTKNIFKLVDRTSRDHSHPAIVNLVKHSMACPKFKKMWDERYIPDVPDKKELSAMPEGSLGRAYLKHLDDNNLDPGIFPQFIPEDEMFYIRTRFYAEHDLTHALLGYDTSVKGELGIIGFSVGQNRSSLSTMIIAAGVLHALKNKPQEAPDYFAAAAEGYVRGKKSKFLLGEDLFSRCSEPLKELRKEFNIGEA